MDMFAGRDLPPGSADRAVQRTLAGVAAVLGAAIREERDRRRLTIRKLAAMANVSPSAISGIEGGRVASMETYVRLSAALRLRPDFTLESTKRRVVRSEDPVHAAMCECVAQRLVAAGLEVRVDEPYQHFQFAGRADVVGWDRECPRVVHVECRTAFPNLQEAIGAYSSKKAYLGDCLAERAGVRRWKSELHVIAALWSAEVTHAIRVHQATFRATCPDPSESFRELWSGMMPDHPGVGSTLVLFDPLEGRRADRRRWIGLDELAQGVRPRYRNYAEALEALESAGLA